jgi:hypothetical protein
MQRNFEPMRRHGRRSAADPAPPTTQLVDAPDYLVRDAHDAYVRVIAGFRSPNHVGKSGPESAERDCT